MYGGKGVFATKDIGEGDLVVSIKQPLIAVVGEDELTSACDHSFRKVFVLREPDLKLHTTPDFKVQLMTCACMVVRCCNRDCQKAAWKRRHKHGCKVFVAVKGYEQEILAGGSLVTNSTFRLLVRMLVLVKNSKISKSHWAELADFATARAENDQRPEIKRNIKWMAVILQKHIGKDVPRRTLRDLISTVSAPQLLRITAPLLKGGNRNCEALIPTTLTEIGIYFDPFVCGIKHSCEANAWVVFEGNELRVRALKSIAAGTELSISWSRGTLADWDAHRAILSDNLGLDCNCVVCQNRGPGPAPAPELIERLKKYDDDRVAEVDDADVFGEIQDTIKEVKSAEFGTANGMYGLYKHAISGYISRRNTVDAVKHLLELYYVVGPARVPRVYPHFRIDTLHNLLSTLTVTSSARQLLITYPRPQEFEPLLAEVMKLVGEVGAGIHCKLVAGTAKYLGEDSMVATFENATLRDYLTNGQFGWAAACQDPSKREYAEVTCNGALHNQYLESMKKLLE